MEVIKIDIIRILKAIETEYGLNEVIKRINNIWQINLSNLLNNDISITYKQNSITITSSNRFPIYTIELHEDFHVLIKTFAGYETTHFYDNNNNLFRKTAIFETQNKEYIALDEMDDERFKSRRIVKTNMKDDTLNNCIFEKELLTYYNPHIEEEYCDLSSSMSKVIKLPNNIAIYHRKRNSIIPEVNMTIESAASVNIPTMVFLGRNKSCDLLLKSFKMGLPNILINGQKKKNSEIIPFKIFIRKYANILVYSVVEKDINTGKEYEEEYNIMSNSQGSITIQDIDSIIVYTSKYLNKYFTEEIINELNRIKQDVLIATNQSLKNVDFIDLKFGLIDDFEHLAFDIYENLNLYDEKIDELLGNNPQDFSTIKRVK